MCVSIVKKRNPVSVIGHDVVKFLFAFICFQADVSSVQSEVHRSGQEGQVYPPDGHRCSRRLQVQVPQFPLDGSGEGRPRDAKEDVHPPGQPRHG